MGGACCARAGNASQVFLERRASRLDQSPKRTRGGPQDLTASRRVSHRSENPPTRAPLDRQVWRGRKRGGGRASPPHLRPAIVPFGPRRRVSRDRDANNNEVPDKAADIRTGVPWRGFGEPPQLKGSGLGAGQLAGDPREVTPLPGADGSTICCPLGEARPLPRERVREPAAPPDPGTPPTPSVTVPQ